MAVADRKAKDIAKWAEGQELPSQEILLLMTQHLPIPDGKRKVIAVNMLPMSAKMTDKAKAELAGVTPRYYYMLTHDPEFNDLLNRETRQMFAIKTPQCAHTYLKVALDGDRQALERIMEQTGVLDPPQRNVNIQAQVTNASLSELVALIKEQQIDDPEIAEVVEVIEEDGGERTGDEGNKEAGCPNPAPPPEGSTPDETEVPGIPQEDKGLSVSGTPVEDSMSGEK